MRSDWYTPESLYACVDARYHPTTDVCASKYNAKCKRFFTRKMDGLTLEWIGVCWCNPPYGRGIVGQWVRKAYLSSVANGATIICLLPVSTGAKWFQLYVLRYAEYQFLPGRLTFGGAPTVAPFWSVLAVFRPGATPGHQVLI
jgi:phage N-6-adenine-methyltransferase